MSKANLFQRYVLIPMFLVTILIATLLYLNQSQTCTASDYAEDSKDRTFTGHSIGEACRKAVAVCTYYSKSPEQCRRK